MSVINTPFRLPVKSVLLVLLMTMAFTACTEKKKAPAKAAASEAETAGSDAAETEGFSTIFDGETLSGWQGDPSFWRVEDQQLIGELTAATPLAHNTFLVYDGGEPGDFELRLEFKIDKAGNSGVNYRSATLDSIPFALRGYQADIDGQIRYTGQNYEERKRTTLAYRGERVAVSAQDKAETPGSLQANIRNNCWQSRAVLFQLGDSEALKTHIAFEDWNALHLIVKGNRMRHFVNGVLMSETVDNDTINRSMTGKLGLQLHVGPPMKVAYRNIFLKEL